MDVTFKQIQTLYEMELYSNLIVVCDLILTTFEERHEVNHTQKAQIMLYFADSFYYTNQYLQAENIYRQLLQMKKFNTKKTTSNKCTDESVNEIDVKYKIHQCCLWLKQKSAAIEILQGIPPRFRTPKIYMALGNLYRDSGRERCAITYYKEVLKECPMALDAVENLLKLGVKGVEVNSLMVEVTPEVNWLNLWLKAQAQLHSHDFTNALQTYKSMDSFGLLKNNTLLLVNMAHCYHYMSDDEQAIFTLQRALRLNQNLVFGRDLLSTLLAVSTKKEHQNYLENLITPNLDMSLWESEHWVVLGNFMLLTKKYERAIYFGQEALLKNRQNIEAFLLKARALIESENYQLAAHHCTEALQICTIRTDLHQCLVECYLKMNKLREAEVMAINACKQLNYSAKALILHASVILKDSVPMASNKKARILLEKAVIKDKHYETEAIPMLVGFLEKEQQHEQACQLLKKHIERKPSAKLHQLLGDCLINLHKDEDAFYHYNIALKLDPTNQKAIEGVNNMGKNLDTNKRENYYENNSTATPATPDQDLETDNEGNQWGNHTFN